MDTTQHDTGRANDHASEQARQRATAGLEAQQSNSSAGRTVVGQVNGTASTEDMLMKGEQVPNQVAERGFRRIVHNFTPS